VALLCVVCVLSRPKVQCDPASEAAPHDSMGEFDCGVMVKGDDCGYAYEASSGAYVGCGNDGWRGRLWDAGKDDGGG
jgi:hypothetical protein